MRSTLSKKSWVKNKQKVSFKAFTVVMFQAGVFCVVTLHTAVVGHQHFRGPCCIPEDGGSMDLWNVGVLQLCYMALQPRRPQLETRSSSICFPKIITCSVTTKCKPVTSKCPLTFQMPQKPKVKKLTSHSADTKQIPNIKIKYNRGKWLQSSPVASWPDKLWLIVHRISAHLLSAMWINFSLL